MTGKNEGKPRRGGTSFFTSKASLVWSCMQAANLCENVLALRDAANEAAFLLGVLWRRGHAAAALALDALRRAHTRRRDEALPRDVRRAFVRAPTNHPQAPPSNLRMHALQSFCFAHEMCRDCRRTRYLQCATCEMHASLAQNFVLRAHLSRRTLAHCRGLHFDVAAARCVLDCSWIRAGLHRASR